MVHIIRCLPELFIDGEEKILAQHPLYNIVRGAYHIKILFASLYFGKHNLIHVEKLVHHFDLFSRLLEVPLFKF